MMSLSLAAFAPGSPNEQKTSAFLGSFCLNLYPNKEDEFRDWNSMNMLFGLAV